MGHWVDGQWTEDQPETRAQLLSRLDPKALAAERERLLRTTRHATAEHIAYMNDVSDAIALRNERGRADDARAAGVLIATEHPPTAATGGRVIVTFEGDNMAWMQNFMSPGASGKFNRDAGKVSETIKHRVGERIAVLGPLDRVVSAADAPTFNQERPI
jgi:hypothetical protein